jgi:hypothetical protein
MLICICYSRLDYLLAEETILDLVNCALAFSSVF